MSRTAVSPTAITPVKGLMVKLINLIPLAGLPGRPSSRSRWSNVPLGTQFTVQGRGGGILELGCKYGKLVLPEGSLNPNYFEVIGMQQPVPIQPRFGLKVRMKFRIPVDKLYDDRDQRSRWRRIPQDALLVVVLFNKTAISFTTLSTSFALDLPIASFTTEFFEPV